MEIQKKNLLAEHYTANIDRGIATHGGVRSDAHKTSGLQRDTVSVSQNALLLTQARRTAQATPDIRTEKVDALRDQVEKGTYTPDSRRTAAKLIQEESSLFQI